jgi:di/tricarboxylate transporter
LGATEDEARRTVEDYLELLDEVVAVDEEVAFIAFEIGCAVEKRFPLVDALIAAAAHGRGACLVHRDQPMKSIAAPTAFSIVSGAVISMLLREAGWPAALVTALLFLAISLAIVFLALRPQVRRLPSPPDWPVILGLAAAISLAALALVAVLFDRLG